MFRLTNDLVQIQNVFILCLLACLWFFLLAFFIHLFCLEAVPKQIYTVCVFLWVLYTHTHVFSVFLLQYFIMLNSPRFNTKNCFAMWVYNLASRLCAIIVPATRLRTGLLYVLVTMPVVNIQRICSVLCNWAKGCGSVPISQTSHSEVKTWQQTICFSWRGREGYSAPLPFLIQPWSCSSSPWLLLSCSLRSG